MMQQALSRRLITSKGRSVRTTFTDQEAVAALASLKGEFAQKLYRLGSQDISRLSPDQLAWVHILAVENAPAVAPAVSSSTAKPVLKAKPAGEPLVDHYGMVNIYGIFAKARTHLKNPSVVLLTQDGLSVKVQVAGANSNYAGQLHVASPSYGEAYYGRIDHSGAFIERQGCPDSVKGLLKEFAANPAEVAAAHGRLTGNCCFCNKKLTDELSTEVGYGKTCAKNFGMPYGKQAKAAAPKAQPAPLPKPTNGREVIEYAFHTRPELFEAIELSAYEGDPEGLTCDGEAVIYKAADGRAYRIWRDSISSATTL